MSKCKICGASFPSTQFVCEYCGHVETERVKKVNGSTTKKISFDDSINLIEDNLNALYQIHRPTISEAIIAVIRIYVIIITFGIIAIFWRKSKKRFNSKEFNKLKAIIKRNIEFLKISAKGSDQLQDRIKVAENELKTVEKEITTSIRIKQFTSTILIIAILALIYFNGENAEKSETEISPISNNVEGNFSDNVEIITKKYSVYYILNENDEYISKLKIKVKLKVKKEYTFSNSELLNVTMHLKDKDGNNLKDFLKSELSNKYRKKIRKAFKNKSDDDIRITFYFDLNENIKEIPKEIKKFSINASIDKFN